MDIDITKEPVTQKEIESSKANLSSDITGTINTIKKPILYLGLFGLGFSGFVLSNFNPHLGLKFFLFFIHLLSIALFTTGLYYQFNMMINRIKEGERQQRFNFSEKALFIMPVTILSVIFASTTNEFFVTFLITFLFSLLLTIMVWEILYTRFMYSKQIHYLGFNICSIDDLEKITKCMDLEEIKHYCCKVSDQKRDLINFELEAIKDFYNKKEIEINLNSIKQAIYG